MELIHHFFKQPSPLWGQVLSLRVEVFVDELHVPLALEIDEFDEEATHLSIQNNNKTIGTLRLVFINLEAKRYVKLGRVAIHADFRRQQIGRKMMLLAIKHCKQRSYSRIVLGSQTYITEFYRSLGFIQQGNVFDDAGIPHVEMSLDLDSYH